MQVLKNRYKKLLAINNLIQHILVGAIIITPIVDIFLNPVTIGLIVLFLFIIFLSSCYPITRFSRKVLKQLFVEGWGSSENMLHYGIKLRTEKICNELLPPLAGIFFYMSLQGNCFIRVAFKKEDYTEDLNYVHEITEDKYEIKDIPISNIVILEEYIEIL